jgi:PAS domain S-box-containing protein
MSRVDPDGPVQTDNTVDFQNVTLGTVEVSRRTNSTRSHAPRNAADDWQSVLAKTPFLLNRCSADLRYLFISDACARMLGRRAEDVEGKPIVDIIGEEAFRTILPHIRQVLQGNSVEFERTIQYQGAGPRFVRVFYTPDRDELGNIQGWIASIIDLTDSIHAAEAERANAVKSRFLAAASHDLRQPLRAAAVYLSLLNKQAKTPEQRELCAKIQAPLQVMTGILDALLDISMLDSGSITPKRSNFALTSILERIAIDLRPLAQQKSLQFDYSNTDVAVNSDPALLERIIENLASNAVRYTTEGSVTIRVERIEDDVRISVADTGIGIPEEALGKIFDEYFQFDNPEGNIKEGLGLGLAIVKRLARLLNHPIHVHSASGKGSVFSVDVPATSVALQTEKVVLSNVGQHGALAVLFIDDDRSEVDSFSRLFAAFGIEAASAGNGNEALARLKGGFRPDVVISDFHLPGGNGFDVIEKLRGTLGYAIPVIVMTGDTSLAQTKSRKVANLTVVQKPVDADALVALVQDLAARPK